MVTNVFLIMLSQYFYFHPRKQKFAFLSATFQGACYFYDSDIELMLGAKHFVKVQRFNASENLTIFKVDPKNLLVQVCLNNGNSRKF